MAKAPGQRGTFGDWLTRERVKRYPERQADALDAYRRIAGLTISPSEYAQWESGSRVPRADNPKVLALYEFYGSRPDDPTPEPPSDLAAAIRELVEELRAARQERQSTEARLRAVESELGSLRARPGGAGSSTRPSPLGTTG